MEARTWFDGPCAVCGAPASVRRRYEDMCQFHWDYLQHEIMIRLNAIRDFGPLHKDNCGPNFQAIFYGWMHGDRDKGPQYAEAGYSTLGYGLYVATSPREAMNEALRTGVRNNWRLLRLDVQGGADHRLYGYSCTDIFVSEDYTKYMEYARKESLPYDAGKYGEIDPALTLEK